MNTETLIALVVLAVVLFWDDLAMAGTFAVRQLSGERREVNLLRVRVAVLKRIAEQIGKDEGRLEDEK